MGARIAEAQIDLNCVRASRRRLLTRLLVDPYYQPKEVNRQRFRLLNWVLGGYIPRNLPLDVDAIKSILKSQDNVQHSVSVPLRDKNRAYTFGSVIMVLSETPELHIAPGPPHVVPYQVLRFAH